MMIKLFMNKQQKFIKQKIIQKILIKFEKDKKCNYDDI